MNLKMKLKPFVANTLIRILTKCEKSMLFYVFDKVNQKTIHSRILDSALVNCMLGTEN